MNDVSKMKKGNARRPMLAIFSAMLMMSLVLLGSGAISTTVAAATANVDARLEPTYRDVTYTMDPVKLISRFDSMAKWNAIGEPSIEESMLVMQTNEGANLTVASSPLLDDGLYYEIRFNVTETTVVFYLELDQYSSSNDLKVQTNASGMVSVTYYTGSATVTTDLGNITNDASYRIGVLFATNQVTVSLFNDRYVAIGSAVLTTASLKAANIDSAILKSTSGLVSVDYFFVASSRTPFNAANMAAATADINPVPTQEEQYYKMQIDFGEPDMTPGSYSDQAWVHDVFGGAISDVDITNDRNLNMTDYGQLVAKQKEGKDSLNGVVKYQGWDSLRTDNEECLRSYLASQHRVNADSITIIDYYVSDLKLNYTWSKDMKLKVQDGWFESVKDMADDLNAEVKYEEGSGIFSAESTSLVAKSFPVTPMAITKKATDVKGIVFPTTVTSKQFADAMESLTLEMRQKGLGAAMVVPDSFANCTNGAFLSLSVGPAANLPLAMWNNQMRNLDDSYQFTDAANGKMLEDEDGVAIDMEKLQTNAQWTAMENGKPADRPVTVASMIGTALTSIILIVLIVVIAIVGAVLIFFAYGKLKGGLKEERH